MSSMISCINDEYSDDFIASKHGTSEHKYNSSISFCIPVKSNTLGINKACKKSKHFNHTPTAMMALIGAE